MRRLIATLVLVLATPVAAQQQTARSADRLENALWRVAEGPGAQMQGRGAPHLSFAQGGRVSGFGGCNLIGGKMLIRDAEIRVTLAPLTRRRCPEVAAQLEDELLAALRASVTYELTPGRLVLTDAEGGGLVLVDPSRRVAPGGRQQTAEPAPTE